MFKKGIKEKQLMDNYIKLGLIIMVLFISVIAFFILNNQKENAYLYFEGNVYVNDGTGWKQANNEMKVYEGYEIKTLENATATIIFYDLNVLTLDSNTEIKIERISKDEIKVFQKLGETWSKVEKITGLKSYEVRSPDVAAVVRGTSFIFGMNNVKVDEGTISLLTKGQEIKVENASYDVETSKLSYLTNKDKELFKQFVIKHSRAYSAFLLNKLIEEDKTKFSALSDIEKKEIKKAFISYIIGNTGKEALKEKIINITRKNLVALNVEKQKELEEKLTSL
jgi:hypothetical protein